MPPALGPGSTLNHNTQSVAPTTTGVPGTKEDAKAAVNYHDECLTAPGAEKVMVVLKVSSMACAHTI